MKMTNVFTFFKVVVCQKFSKRICVPFKAFARCASPQSVSGGILRNSLEAVGVCFVSSSFWHQPLAKVPETNRRRERERERDWKEHQWVHQPICQDSWLNGVYIGSLTRIVRASSFDWAVCNLFEVQNFEHAPESLSAGFSLAASASLFRLSKVWTKFIKLHSMKFMVQTSYCEFIVSSKPKTSFGKFLSCSAAEIICHKLRFNL